MELIRRGDAISFNIQVPASARLLPSLSRCTRMNRHRFPGLQSGWVRLDGPSGSQILDSCSAAVACYMTGGHVANLDAPSIASRTTAQLLQDARSRCAALLGGEPEGLVFGGSASLLTARFANAVGPELGSGDEIICTGLDHDANVSPWLDVAGRRGACVKIARPDPISLELEPQAITSLLTPRTRWVAMTAASNVNGATPDIAFVAETVHASGAFLFIDGVHAMAHDPRTLAQSGADAIVCSAYKWFGPHLSALWVRPHLLSLLRPDRIRPGPSTGPRVWERGALPFELLPGLIAACDYSQSLDWDEAHRHEQALLAALISGLAELPGVSLVGNPSRRVSTVAFKVEGRAPAAINAALAERRVAIGNGDFYAVELFSQLPFDSCLRAGILHYNDMEDVERLLEALRAVI